MFGFIAGASALFEFGDSLRFVNLTKIITNKIALGFKFISIRAEDLVLPTYLAAQQSLSKQLRNELRQNEKSSRQPSRKRDTGEHPNGDHPTDRNEQNLGFIESL